MEKIKNEKELDKFNDPLYSSIYHEIENAEKYSRSFSILLCDLTNMSEIYARYGSQTGAVVLKTALQAITHNLRSNDRVYKFKDDAYICIMPDASSGTAEAIAERIHERVSGLDFNVPERNPIHVRLDIGYAQYCENAVNTVDSMLLEAYRAMLNEQVPLGIKEPFFHAISCKKSGDKQRYIIRGEHLTGGVASGKAYVLEDNALNEIENYPIQEAEIGAELGRIGNAVREVIGEIEEIKKDLSNALDENNAGIFEVHRQILMDNMLFVDFEREIRREPLNAEQIVRSVFRKWYNRIIDSENEIIRSKADIFEDLSRRILTRLTGNESGVMDNIPKGSILVAKKFTPTEAARLLKSNVRGIIIDKASLYSHSSIIIKNLGVPALINMEQTVDSITGSDDVILDCEKGVAIVNPCADERYRYKLRTLNLLRSDIESVRRTKGAAKTADGERVFVYANTSSPEDFISACDKGCDGIGIYRTEHIYYSQKSLPDEKFLSEYLFEILKPVKNMLVNIRMLDVGGDKKLPYLNVDTETDPFLGLRGIRFLLKNEKILKTQIKSIIRVNNEYNLRVLVPMVTFAEEVLRVRELFTRCREEIECEGAPSGKEIKIGSMIETPAAVINLKKISLVSDFLSIGTNDLIQYTLAAGRDNPNVSGYYERGPDVIYRLIKNIIGFSLHKNIECSICGEIAGNLNWTERLLKAGVRHLSVSPNIIPFLKDKIRSINTVPCGS